MSILYDLFEITPTRSLLVGASRRLFSLSNLRRRILEDGEHAEHGEVFSILLCSAYRQDHTQNAFIWPILIHKAV